jgi:hypothetical protein
VINKDNHTVNDVPDQVRKLSSQERKTGRIDLVKKLIDTVANSDKFNKYI